VGILIGLLVAVNREGSGPAEWDSEQLVPVFRRGASPSVAAKAEFRGSLDAIVPGGSYKKGIGTGGNYAAGAKLVGRVLTDVARGTECGPGHLLWHQ
jgi:hypothetical protein